MNAWNAASCCAASCLYSSVQDLHRSLLALLPYWSNRSTSRQSAVAALFAARYASAPHRSQT